MNTFYVKNNMYNKVYINAIIIIWIFLIFPNTINAVPSGSTMGAGVIEGGGTTVEKNYDLSNIEDSDTDIAEIQDPFEPFNRGMFAINKGFDELLIKPAARIYEAILPKWCRDRVDNFINNLYEPISCINAVAQGDWALAEKNVGRFISNSIVGLGGLFDIAGLNHEELAPHYTDFGLTLKQKGITTGPYVVLPVFGPSSFRDAIGLGVDAVADPFSHIFKRKVIIGRYIGETIHFRYKTLDISEDLSKTSLDEYATIRSIYFQKR